MSTLRVTQRHTHTHTHTHTCTRAHTHTHRQTRARAHTDTHAHTHARTQKTDQRDSKNPNNRVYKNTKKHLFLAFFFLFFFFSEGFLTKKRATMPCPKRSTVPRSGKTGSTDGLSTSKMARRWAAVSAVGPGSVFGSDLSSPLCRACLARTTRSQHRPQMSLMSLTSDLQPWRFCRRSL